MKQPSPSLRRPSWLDDRLLLVLIVTLFLFAAGAFYTRPSSAANVSAPIDAPQTTFLPPADQTPAPSRTPYPPELLNNRRQTVGISLVAAILVLIVAGGVFSVMLRERKSP